MKLMKRALILALVVISCVLCLTACGAKGTYKLESITVANKEYDVGDYYNNKKLKKDRYVLELKGNDKFIWTETEGSYSQSVTGKWKVKGSEIILTVDGEEYMKGEIDDNTITFEMGSIEIDLEK